MKESTALGSHKVRGEEPWDYQESFVSDKSHSENQVQPSQPNATPRIFHKTERFPPTRMSQGKLGSKPRGANSGDQKMWSENRMLGVGTVQGRHLAAVYPTPHQQQWPRTGHVPRRRLGISTFLQGRPRLLFQNPRLPQRWRTARAQYGN